MESLNCQPRQKLFSWRRLIGLAIPFFCLGPQGAELANAGNLVVAPHPDADVLFAAGVVYRSIGVEETTVVYITNGDIKGVATGLQRQAEAVSAQTTQLGTTEPNLIFLGYPEGALREIFTNYQSATSQYCTSFSQCVTYGNRGVGGADYHSFRFGAPAAYNYANMVLDLQTLIDTYRPAHIYTTSEFDQGYDYKITYRAVKAAVAAIRAQYPSYAPVIHATIVWATDANAWPPASDPNAYLGPPPGLTSTPLQWSQRESLDVPVSLQDPNLQVNPKFRAIEANPSQTRGANTHFIERFAHKDEIFWAEGTAPGNTPPVAEAGPDIPTAAGATAILDGSRSRDPDGQPLTFQWSQRSGPAVVLDDASAMYPQFTVPAFLATDQVWSFDLLVSDGVLTSATDTAKVFAVVQTQNIARQAAVAASSESLSLGQPAASAVDGVIGGYPEINQPEWRSNSERAGAWMRLTWPQPVVIDRVRLYDRPNLTDRITAAVLNFSDGTTVSVGTLDNDARSGTEVSFAPRTVTSVTLVVTAVSSSTSAVGLAEFQAFGRLAASGDSESPTMPGTLAVSGTTSSSISLGWIASTDTGGSGLAGYRVYRDGSATPLTSVIGTTYADNGLASSSTHTYRVTAYDLAGNESVAAGPVSGTTQSSTPVDTTAPSVPGSLTVSGTTDSSISLTWSSSTDVGGSGLAGYRIYRDGSATPLASVTGLTHTDGGLVAASTHTYRVTAYDIAGNESAAVGPVSGTTQPPPDTTAPSVPGNLAISATTSSSISLSWSASTDTGGSGLAGYRIYRDGSGTPLASVSGTTYTNSGLAAASTHTYRVAAYDVAGNESAGAGPVTGITQPLPDTAAPSVPGNLNVNGTTASSIVLAWSASTDTGGSGLGGYRVYRDNVAIATVTNTAGSVLGFDIPATETIFTSAVVGDYQFTSEHFHLPGDGGFASNGTTYLAYEGGRGRPITMTRVNGAAFSILDFDGAEAVTQDPASRPSAESIGVIGTRVDGSTVSVVLVLDGINDGPAGGSANDFQHFVLPTPLTELVSVLFYGIRADGRVGGIAIDNIGFGPNAAGSVTTYTDTGLEADSSHSYGVTAYDVAGNESAQAGPVTGTTQALPDTVAPSVPGNLAVSGATSTSISLSWSASSDTGDSGLAGYRIYRDGGATPLTSTTSTSFTDTGLASDASHTYRVSAYDVAGNESAQAGPVTGTTQPPPDTAAPSVPGNLAVSTSTSTSISLSWNASSDTGGSGLAGYRIYRDGGATPLTSTTSTSFTNTGLASDTSHTYRVSAYDVAGNESAQAGPVTGTTQALPDTVAPSVPGNLAVSTSTSTSISLNWSASTDTGGSGLAGYRIYRDGGATPLTSTTSTSFTDSGLTASTSHAYRVSAYDVAGNESAQVGPVTGTTQAQQDAVAPSIPLFLSVTSTTSTSITLRWNPSTDTGGSGVAGYRIYRNGAATLYATVSGATFTDSGLVTGTSFSYRVTAYDGAGNESPPARAVTGTAREVQAPSVPQNLHASNVTSNSLALAWQASTDAGGSGFAGYRVFRDGAQVATTTTTSFADSGLTANQQYRYAVSAFDNAGNQSSQSGQLPVTTTN